MGAQLGTWQLGTIQLGGAGTAHVVPVINPRVWSFGTCVSVWSFGTCLQEAPLGLAEEVSRWLFDRTVPEITYGLAVSRWSFGTCATSPSTRLGSWTGGI